MVQQKSFAELAFDAPRKVTKRELFLTEMDRVIPWSELLALIEPHYPRPKAHGGRPALALETKLRIYCLQQFYSLSDPGAEEALIDSEAMRRFAGIRLAEDTIPDESTLLQFRRLLERHQLTEAIFQAVKEHLVRHGLLLKEGTLVDATLIHAPSSTKNRDRARDPDMTSTKKGNQWYFGMKAHIGTDAKGRVHSLTATTAKVADCTQFDPLLHGEESVALGDRGYDYPGVHEALKTRDVGDGIAIRRRPGIPLSDDETLFNQAVSKLRARVEHPFRVLKRQFGYAKTRYRGLAKNSAHLHALFAMVNLYAVRHELPDTG